MVARQLWETCAVPAFLYGSKAMWISNKTIGELEKLQSLVGKFILQIPGSSSKVSTWIDAGLMPIKYRIWLKQSRYRICRGVYRGGAMGAQPPPGKVKALIFRGVSAPNSG